VTPFRSVLASWIISDVKHDPDRPMLRAALGAGDRGLRDRRRVGEPVPDLAEAPDDRDPALMGSSPRRSTTACTLCLRGKSSGMWRAPEIRVYES
jgi:hypothetical protein